MAIAVVQFDNYGKFYEFKTAIELEKGDQVVVDTSNGLVIGEVQAIKNISSRATKWVIQRIDLESHNERLRRETKLGELKKQMEARRKKAEEMEVYKILSERDDEMKKLLEEFNELNKAYNKDVY